MAEARITQYQLADALKGMRLAVRTGEGDLAAGGLVNGEVHVPDNVALHVFRSVGAAHPTGPRLADADLCARCGNQFKPGQVCDSCRVLTADPWADEHDSDGPGPNAIGMDHVCEHPIGDREVQLMVDILRGMAGLDRDAKQRIRNWVDERFVPRGQPF